MLTMEAVLKAHVDSQVDSAPLRRLTTDVPVECMVVGCAVLRQATFCAPSHARKLPKLPTLVCNLHCR